MGAGPIRALTGGRRTKPTSTGCRRLRQPEPGRRATYQAGEPVQTNRASSILRSPTTAEGRAGAPHQSRLPKPGMRHRPPFRPTSRGPAAVARGADPRKVPPAMDDRTCMAAAQMTDASDDRRDFFVSFNQADREWATWIAWVLENGYSVFFQD